ncbi:MAG: hypothetical protein HY073_03725 [Deltaproteobacteria bacterium]|nr:hypothetical protein [Deltaproteobacteria bacterium]
MSELALKAIETTVTQSVPGGSASGGTKSVGVPENSDFSRLMAEVGKPDAMPSPTSSISNRVLEAFGMSGDGSQQLKAISAEGLEINPKDISSSQSIQGQSKVVDYVSEINRSGLQMEELTRVASSGKSFSPGELLALQAAVHTAGMEIELGSKVVEMANSSFKTLQNTNFA